MSSSLREIISNCYLEIRNSGSSLIMFNRYQIAGLVLGKMYEIYDRNSHNSSLMDIEFFLNIKNPIKHIKNILDNSSDEAHLTIEGAIIKEIKLIKETFENGTSLLQVVEKELLSLEKENFLKNMEYRLLILERIESEMVTLRLNGKLSNDDKDILNQEDKYDLLSSIIERKLSGELLSVAVSDVYIEISSRKSSGEGERFYHSMETLTNEVEHLKKSILEITEEFTEIHRHIDHVGQQTFGVMSTEQSSPVPKNRVTKEKFPKLFERR